jgi:hypothetical protein
VEQAIGEVEVQRAEDPARPSMVGGREEEENSVPRRSKRVAAEGGGGRIWARR